jgi:hypothetical protein
MDTHEVVNGLRVIAKDFDVKSQISCMICCFREECVKDPHKYRYLFPCDPDERLDGREVVSIMDESNEIVETKVSD